MNSKFVANLFKSCGLLVPFVVVSCGENPEKVLTLSNENEEQKEEQNVEVKKEEQPKEEEKKDEQNVEVKKEEQPKEEEKKDEQNVDNLEQL